MENMDLPALENKTDLTPRQIVEKLDQYIIGQEKAKRAVSVALRNRVRRLKLDESIRDEVAPKNILMIGPTGSGKTEIARRLAKLCNAPFVKVEATKYTEVGYVGRDVESMVRDLMLVGFKDVKAEMEEVLREKAQVIVEEKLLDLLLPGTEKKENPESSEKGSSPSMDFSMQKENTSDSNVIYLGGAGANLGSIFENASEKTSDFENASEKSPEKERDNSTREKFRKMLREGKLEDREVEVKIKPNQVANMEIIAGSSVDDLQSSLQNLSGLLSGFGKSRKRTVSIKEARKILTESTLDSMVDNDKVIDIAKKRVENSGIIFIDEIDKIAVHGESHGQGVSREGVQRDILPIVEGSNVSTKFGMVNTTHILFIAAGAFSLASPSDLIPELQGRFPLRVELENLNKEDFKRILTEPKNSLVMQYTALLETEGVKLDITDEAIDRMSFIAEDVNNRAENIGARRLHTIMEKVLSDINFEADEHAGETFVIDKAYVDEKMKDVIQDEDLSRYIL